MKNKEVKKIIFTSTIQFCYNDENNELHITTVDIIGDARLMTNREIVRLVSTMVKREIVSIDVISVKKCVYTMSLEKFIEMADRTVDIEIDPQLIMCEV